jgi:serine/threonine-protein kinase
VILDDVLSALAAAHAIGILHRDIKPANILFSDSGATKVADFGIAKSVDAVHTLTGQVFGTMAYLSPERIAGRPATASDDLYALGVVGYEALAGRRPFPQETLPELARAIAQDTPPPLGALRPDADPALVATIERAMARDPQWRFGSAQQMRAALAGHMPSLPATRPPTMVLANPLPDPSTMVVAPQRRRSRSRMLLGVAAALVAAVVAVAAFIADSMSRAPAPEPASTSTSVPAPPSPSFVPPPPPTTTPVPIEQPGPKKGGGNGNGNGRKPKHG